jgi:hypothetical protein
VKIFTYCGIYLLASLLLLAWGGRLQNEKLQIVAFVAVLGRFFGATKSYRDKMKKLQFVAFL